MLLFRLIYRHISRRLPQSILFVVGVALGVAVGVAIDLANNSASRAFSLSTQSLTGRTTHQIVGGPAGLDADFYRQVREELGGQPSAPIVESYVRVVSLNDQPLRLLGIDPLAEAPFRSYLSRQIEAASQADLATYAAFVSQPNTVLISQTLADRFGLQVGDSLTLRLNERRGVVKIVGLLQPSDTLSKQALDDLMLAELGTAQTLLNMSGRLTRIDLILPDDYDTSRISAILPPGAALLTPRQRTDALGQMTNAFEVNLRALSLLALVVGVFLIYNTVMFSVVQRRGVIGIMRSLGTTKRQIFALVIGEALLLGLIGTLLGLALGVLMGRMTVGAVSQSISDLYFRVNVQEIAVDPITLVRGSIIGIAASLGAALLPAFDATRTTPAGSMRRSELEQNTLRLLPYVTGVGIAMSGGGVLVLQIRTQNLVISFGALFMVIIGAALFTPLSMVVLLRLMTPLSAKIFGVLGKMASRAVIRSLSRTSIAVAALTLAVSVIVGVGVMIASFRLTVINWLDILLGADIYISTPAASSDSAPNFDPSLADQLAAVDGIETVALVRQAEVIAPAYPDLPPVNVVAISMDISGGRRRFAWTTVPADEDYRQRLPLGQVMVSETFAFHRGITPEKNTITLLTEQGEQTFEVFGVFYDYTTDQGALLMDLEVYRRYFNDPYLTSFGLFLEPDTNLAAVIQTLKTETLAGMELQIQSNRELRAGALEVFDRTFSITAALQVVATLVAFIGILSALMALQLEHGREYGIMRANGMTPFQLRVFTLLQTGLMGIVSGVFALPIGLALAAILLYVINVRSFGWSMDLILPPKELGQAFGVALLAALAAGIYPAWRVSNLQAADAIRGE